MVRAYVIDDEPLAIKVIESHLSRIDFVELVMSTTKVLEAVKVLQHDSNAIIYLDIQMPDLTGIQLMNLIHGKYKVILTTAHQQYAIQGYEYDVTDYLLKPISFERFLQATQKAAERINIDNKLAKQSVLNVELPSATKDFFFLKTSYKLVKVNFDDILFIEGGKDYATVYTTKEKILSLNSLSNLLEHLPEGKFIRVHKSYIISISKITTIEKQIIKIDQYEIPLGAAFKDDFNRQLPEV